MQSVVVRSSAEAEYRAMALTSCEITWIVVLLKVMGLQDLPLTVLYCDNKSVIAIAANLILYERTKHIEVDCHFIRDKIRNGFIVTKHVPSHSQVVYILTKSVSIKQHYSLLHKLGATSSATHLRGSNEEWLQFSSAQLTVHISTFSFLYIYCYFISCRHLLSCNKL